MNTKHLLAAIFTVVVLSISFLSCEDKEDDTNNPATTDVVKEIYGFYGKPVAQVVSVLDNKGWTKNSYPLGQYTDISYFNSDTTKKYIIEISNNIVIRSTYIETESKDAFSIKLQENANYFLSQFEKWGVSLKALFPSTAYFQGSIMADNLQITQGYTDYEKFLTDFQAKKATLNLAQHMITSEQITGFMTVKINYTEKKSNVYVEFYSTY